MRDKLSRFEIARKGRNERTVMRVSYDQNHRAEARKTGKRLYTFQIAGPGGGGSITSQGFFAPDTLKHIKNLVDVMFGADKKEPSDG